KGNVTFNVDLPSSSNMPGMMKANLICRIFEKGGDVSIFSKSVSYSPFESYVGINLGVKNRYDYLETDVKHTFEVVAVNGDGKPINNDEIEYKIYKMGWNWWYEYDSYSLTSYLQSRSNTAIASGKVKISNGRGEIDFKVDYPDWGRFFVYVVDRKSGHATGGFVMIDWPIWRGRSNKEDPTALKMLTFAADKESYEVGDVASVFIPGAKGGRALVAIENGAEVLHREWVILNENTETKHTFKITEAMSPNVYLHISVIQPHDKENDLPLRMYGVIPIFVHNKSSILDPVIIAPEVLQPEKEFTVKVSEKNKRSMTYTLAVVDEGLLDITNFKTPDPWSHFYAREALGVKTWDMYDLVIGAQTGTLGTMLAIGGDEGGKRPDPKANRFKPVVKFLGPFTLKKGEEKSHKIMMPSYIGSVRIMVVAGQEDAYGNAEKTVPVRSPLMVLASLPRVTSTDETISLPINIFSMEKTVKSVTVKVATTGKLKLAEESSQTIKFEQPGDQIVNFLLKSGSLTGVEKITITATGNGQTAVETIEIDVRNPNPPVINLTNRLLEVGESATLPFVVNAGSDSWAKMEVSRIPFVDISRRVDFLYNYHHLCTEQLTSCALPLLYISNFKDVDQEEKERITTNVREAIQSLYARQTSSGGFVYWPGSSEPNEWVTSYAGLFLVTAKEKGYEVNQEVIDKWKQYQRDKARSWRATSYQGSSYYYDHATLTQAFRLYTLALVGSSEKGAMNRLKEMKDLDVQTLWRLAATYALIGNKNVAEELVKNKAAATSPTTYYNYGSPIRDDAMILETMLLLGQDKEAFQQARRISEKMAKEYSFSTQSTAFGLMAMGKMAEKMSGSLQFDWHIDNEKNETIVSAKSIFQQDISNKTGNRTLKVTNKSDGIIYVSTTSKYTPVRDTLPAKNSNIRLEVHYEDMDGGKIDAEKLVQGVDFYAVVEVKNISANKSYTDLALTHIVPSGWEINNERLNSSTDDNQYGNRNSRYYDEEDYYDDDKNDYYNAGNSSSRQNKITYQDIRDDRVLSYFDLGRNQSVKVRIRLTASYLGDFVLPAVQCEAMYDTEVFARSKAGRAKVVRSE
ncbi:alpha-2-macroglobulin, partial [Bacteroidales bacterium OttesenSCG-928-C03]|nr:alpha-2-macroglobulin [Bacteroidales bacterium OttesenSCG-928-C03]